VEHDGHLLTVIELDGRRASRIRLTTVSTTGSTESDVAVGELPA
jgi:hypothetical protein